MPRDVTCGAEVDRDTPYRIEVGGVTYYFCCQECLDEYLEDDEIVTHPSEEDIKAGG